MHIPNSLAHLFVMDKGWPLHPSARIIVAWDERLREELQLHKPLNPSNSVQLRKETGTGTRKSSETQWVTAASLVGALGGQDALRGGLLHSTVLISCSCLWSLPGSSLNQADENAHASHSPVPPKLKPKTAIHTSLCVEGMTVSCLRDQDTRMLLRLAS